MTSLINLPVPSKVPHQKSIDVNDLFLTRFLPPWSRPASLPAYTWRAWVLNQPVAIDCRETLIASTLALDWKITPIDSNYQQELDGTIKHYTKLFKNGGNYPGLGLDYSGLIEWIAADILDTPFGGAAEIGHRDGEPGGRVQWIRPLDAGTLYPTLNQDFPVIQYWQGWDAVVFEAHEISRVFMSPHTFIWREGWGMAPPEKVYFAMDLLGRGDKYYANLLLDVPTAGILDLGDMEKSSAEEWITAFKSFVNDNQTSFRVPVLYEHNNKVEFIPFGKVPNDIMFDKITLKYAALVCAAYGMSLSDIGLQTTSASGETLAGSIRQERRTKRTGFARLKMKLKAFFDNILPKSIEFNFIDYDDELNVALGKARLASATAFGLMQDKGQINAQEARSQYIQDGLFSISMPDELPPDAKPLVETQNAFEMDKVKETNKEPELIGEKKPPSAGGEGEVKRSKITYRFNFKELSQVISDMCVRMAPKIFEIMNLYGEDELLVARSLVNDDIFGNESLGVFDTVSNMIENKSLIKFSLTELEPSLKDIFGTKYTSTLKSRIHSDVNSFLVRSIAHHINESLFTLNLDDELNYESIIRAVHDKVFKSLDEYLTAYINAELTETREQVTEIINEQSIPDVGNNDVLDALSKLSGEIQNLALVSKTPVQKFEPIINLPEIYVNNSFPKQDSNITVESPIVNISNPLSVPAPVVNVNTPEFPDQDIIVNVPKQDSPVVNVSVPEQASPTVVVTNQVSPTPVEIISPVTVNMPKQTKQTQKIHRDRSGFMDSTETEIHYEDKE